MNAILTQPIRSLPKPRATISRFRAGEPGRLNHQAHEEHQGAFVGYWRREARLTNSQALEIAVRAKPALACLVVNLLSPPHPNGASIDGEGWVNHAAPSSVT